jgi:arylsulfatase A-like enzyme
MLEETAIVVSADHGEQFGEWGVYGDHCAAASAVQNVPLVVAWPGVTPADRVCPDLVLNVDLAPTLCELLGLPVPPGWDGTSLARQLRGEAAPDWREHVVYTHGLYCCQRAVRTHRWQLTRTYHPGTFLHEQVQLHDMAADPYQTANLAPGRPEGVDPLQQVVETGPWKYVRLDSWLQRLEEWDRPEMAAAIRRRLGLEPASG